jgi:type II secretory pathway pseudopilin PulG
VTTVIVLVFLAVVLIGGTAAYLITTSTRNTKKQNRELEFRKAEKAILVRKQKAITSGDSFEVFSADQDLEALAQRYIAGKEKP